MGAVCPPSDKRVAFSSAQEDSGNTQFSLRYTGSGPDFSVQMLSSTLLRTFAGVTSSDAIDISSPYLAAGTVLSISTVQD